MGIGGQGHATNAGVNRNTTLYGVLHGTGQSRALDNGTHVGSGDNRASVAVYDDGLQSSPARIDPNKVLKRERQGATDQKDEHAYRRENYLMFRDNIEKAFKKFDVNNDEKLSREEFLQFFE